MAAIVAFVSQKGGVGKSTLARALAREAAAGGLRVKVADLDTLTKAGVPNGRLAFALNRIGTPAEEVAARVYLQQAGYTVLDGSLRDRPAYRQAQNTGHSITETRFAGLNERADTLIQSLIDRVTNG
ncbi:TPA: AAA family ATPase [Escherichia coli]|nr:ParA family protein [Escherichia coli]